MAATSTSRKSLFLVICLDSDSGVFTLNINEANGKFCFCRSLRIRRNPKNHPNIYRFYFLSKHLFYHLSRSGKIQETNSKWWIRPRHTKASRNIASVPVARPIMIKCDIFNYYVCRYCCVIFDVASFRHERREKNRKE